MPPTHSTTPAAPLTNRPHLSPAPHPRLWTLDFGLWTKLRLWTKPRPWINRLGLWTKLLASASLLGADWPQYRGPNHDGIALETIRLNWSQEPPRYIWQTALDPALSSFAIAEGKALTQVRRRTGADDQEFCVALDAATGMELWATQLDIADYPGGGVGDDDGPRSTPSVDNGLVFVTTSYLHLYCLDVATGTIVWSKDLKTEYGAKMIGWQNAASPLIVGDCVILNTNGRQNEHLVAFRKQDGALIWRGQSDGLTHATPVAATIKGVPQVIFFAQSGLVSVAPENGTVLWRHPLRYNGTSVAASPVVAGDLVYCSRSYPASLSAAQAGAVVLRISGSAGGLTATTVWSKVNQLLNHWSTPVQHNGYVYGMYGHGVLTFKCVELATGNEKWSVSGFGYGSVLQVSDKIVVLSATGDLVLVDPNPEAYTELGRFHAVDGKCWNVPAISNGRIYVRSTTAAACVDVSVKSQPRLRLQSGLAGNNPALFRLSILTDDSSPLDPSRSPNISILVTSDPTSSWNKLPNSPMFTNGELRFEEPLTPSQSPRFFKVEERQ